MLALDLQALQSPMSQGRGIGRYALDLALAIEDLDPGIVAAYLLNGDLGPPTPCEALASTGKLTYDRRLPDSCRVLHVMSPFDLDVGIGALWGEDLGRSAVARSATVYDLIPLTGGGWTSTDPIDRRRYRARLEALRAADQLQVLSAAVGRELVEVVGIEESRVVRVGAAPDRRFVAPQSKDQARRDALRCFAGLGLRTRYVFYPSGSHPRKNNERLVRAFARVAAAAPEPTQLLLSAGVDAPTANHYRELAASLGIDDLLVLSDYLSDAALLTGYQGAELVCFPSLAEGFGLPIAEALACGTPVVASDRPPLDELLGREHRFDPTDEVAIADAVTSALASPTPPAQRRAPDWTEVATRCVDGLLSLARSRPRQARPDRPSRRGRPRLAFVTPLPPAPSGVAGYSFHLLQALSSSEKLEIDVFVEHGREGALAPEGVALYSGRSLPSVEALRGRYDHVVYTMGNSHHHLDALALLWRRPGVVLAHDVRLSGLYRQAHGDPAVRPGGFERTLAEMYPALPPGTGANGEVSDDEIGRFGLYMARDVIARSSAFLVSSRAALALARAEAGPEAANRVAIVPFAIAAPDSRLDGEAAPSTPPDGLGLLARRWGIGPDSAAREPLIAHFGIVDPLKQPEMLLRALSSLRAWGVDAQLAFVGPIADVQARELAALAEELEIAPRLLLTGAVDGADYRAWLQRATVAVQPRATFNGEASAAVGECLASGVPTVVSQLGWARDLPLDAVVALDARASGDDLATLLDRLLGDAQLRDSLAHAGRRFAAASSFALSARALLSYLDLAASSSR